MAKGAILKLALREYFYSFSFKRKVAPGARDFLALTLLLGLLVAFGAVLYGARDGLMNNFSDSLLGKIEGYGVPLWVTSHPENFVNKGISRRVDELFIESKKRSSTNGGMVLENLTLHPYIYIESGDPLVRLPGEFIWGEMYPGDKQIFDGWAVAAEDPLRKWVGNFSSDVSLPLTIAINKSLFAPRFSMKNYRDALSPFLPKEKLPKEADEPGSLKSLWLHLWVQDRFELVEFEVRWVDSFPALQKLVYLFPLETYQALTMTRRTALKYAPEGLGSSVPRANALTFYDINLLHEGEILNSEGISKFDLLAQCLEVDKPANDGFDVQFADFEIPVALNRIEDCQSVAGLSKELDMQVTRGPSDQISYDLNHFINIPCKITGDCLKDDNGQILWAASTSIDMYEFFSGANVYVADRKQLAQAKDILLDLRIKGNQVFYLNPVYQDAILRFSYLTKTLDWIQIPLLLVYFSFVLALLWVQLTIVIHHRINNYGVMLTKGIRWYQVKSLLYIQIFVSVICGGVVVGGFVELVGKGYFNHAFSGSAVAEIGRASLGIQSFSLVPQHFREFLLILGVTLALALLVLEILMWRVPLKRSTSPMDLV